MKHVLAVVMALLLATAATTVFAKDEAKSDKAEYKFGYVNFQQALNEVEEGKKAKAVLKTEFEEKQKKLDEIQRKLQAMKEDLEKQRLILSADALKEKEEEYRKLFIELQQKIATYKEELQTKEGKLTSDILTIIHCIVQDVGTAEGYTMILEKSQDVVLYSQADADLTDTVIKKYNKLNSKQKKDLLKKYVGTEK